MHLASEWPESVGAGLWERARGEGRQVRCALAISRVTISLAVDRADTDVALAETAAAFACSLDARARSRAPARGPFIKISQ